MLNNTGLSPVEYQIKFERERRRKSLGIILFKPNCPPVEIRSFRDYCRHRRIRILEKKKVMLSRSAAIALYSRVFSLSQGDLRYGVKWKRQLLEHMLSGPITAFFLEGMSILPKLFGHKRRLRARYGKISKPSGKISSTAFLESAIKNYVHVIDKGDIQNGLWILFEK